MISISCKYHKIIKPIIQAIPINMVDNLTRQQVKMFGNDLAASTLALTVSIIRSLLFGIKISVITFNRTVHTFSISDLAAHTANYFTTCLTGDVHPFIFSRVDSVALEQLPKSLAGSVIPFSKFD